MPTPVLLRQPSSMLLQWPPSPPWPLWARATHSESAASLACATHILLGEGLASAICTSLGVALARATHIESAALSARARLWTPCPAHARLPL